MEVRTIAPDIIKLFSAIGVTIGSVSGGTVIVTGVVLIGGIYLMAKAGEKISDVVKTKASRKQYDVCCCKSSRSKWIF